jgi:hypothetical protein
LTAPDGEAFCGIRDSFLALGGIADNVQYGRGPNGRGLFAIDPAKPVRLSVPRSLLFPTDAVAFADGKLTLSPQARAGEQERRFFATYQNALSWAQGGRAEVVAFLDLVHTLPERARTCLAKDFGLAYLFEPHDEAAILERFIRARHFDFHGMAVLMPVLELCNHSRHGVDFDVGPDHVGVSGHFADGEVLLRYGVADSWQRFVQYGFVCEERAAYSLPIEIRLQSGRLGIGHDPTDGRRRNGYVMPRIAIERERVTLSHLLLGDRDLPHAPRSVFIAAALEAGIGQPAIVFDRIAHINRTTFLKLLAAVEDEDGGPAPAAIRRLARLQLEALSFAVGARDLDMRSSSS